MIKLEQVTDRPQQGRNCQMSVTISVSPTAKKVSVCAVKWQNQYASNGKCEGAALSKALKLRK